MFARFVKYRYVREQPVKPWGIIIPGFLMFFGVGIISWVVWPIVSFKLLVAPRFTQLIEPVPQSVYAQENKNTNRQIDDTSVDYTKASVWFPQVSQKETEDEGESYTISIPKLKIQDTKAIVGSEDLSKSLIHFGGTAMPGKYGNAVVFGHSTLPYFFDPKNYTTIFSTLPKMEIGDEIYVNYDGLRYKYIVEEMIVVKPKDTQILEQKFDDSYLTLVTCVPPGTYLERLVVRSRLQKTNNE